VPVRAELLTQTLEFERRMLNCFTKGLKDRSAIWRSLPGPAARPKACSPPRASAWIPLRTSCSTSLRRKSANSRCALNRTVSRLRDQMLKDGMKICAERTTALGRGPNAPSAPAPDAGRATAGWAGKRLLDSVSHKIRCWNAVSRWCAARMRGTPSRRAD